MNSQDMSFNPGENFISISDASTMLKKQLFSNERPYTAAVIKSNNALVSEWHEKVLKKICNKKSAIQAQNVWPEWQYFYVGKTLPQFIEALNNGFVMRASERVIDYWTDIFKNCSIEELIGMGAPLVGYGWKIINDENYIQKCLDRWEFVYSKSDDPLQWRKLANSYPRLWSSEAASIYWSPEELQEITEKVQTVLKIAITPD